MAATWAGLRLPTPWRPQAPVWDAQELFASRFDLPAGAKICPVQETAVQLAWEMRQPGLMVIEAPIEERKTEQRKFIRLPSAAIGCRTCGCSAERPATITSPLIRSW